MKFLEKLSRVFPSQARSGLIEPNPGDSSVLDNSLRQTPGDTASLAAETIVAPRPKDTIVPSIAGKVKALLDVLENSRGHSRFELSHGGSQEARRQMAAELNGRVLSNGAIIDAKIEGEKAIITLLNYPIEVGLAGNTVAGLNKELISVEKAIRDEKRQLPVKVNVPQDIDRNYLKHFAGNLREILGRDGTDKVRINVNNDAARELCSALDGRILRNGQILRVSSSGEFYTETTYRLGEHGWSIEDLKRDFAHIKENAKQAAIYGVKTKVWLNPQELIASPLANNIRAAFAKLRQSELGDLIDLHTNRQYVDKLPGFIGVKHHVARFEAQTLANSPAEMAEIARCESFINGEKFKRPLVLWIKRDSVGPAVSDYIKELYSQFGDDLKLVCSCKLKAEIAKLIMELREPQEGSVSKGGGGSWLRRGLSSWKQRFRGLKTVDTPVVAS